MTKVTIEIEQKANPVLETIIASVDNTNKWTISKSSVNLLDDPEETVAFWEGYLADLAEIAPSGVFNRIYRSSTARRFADNAVLNLRELGVKAEVTATEDMPSPVGSPNGRPPPIY